MFSRQLGQLLCKDLRYMWRSKCWTVFEIVLPLLVSVPLILILAKYFGAENEPKSVFESFEVAGNWNDISRNIHGKSIADYYCGKPKSFAVTFSDEKLRNVAVGFAEELRTRYEKTVADTSSNFTIKIKIFDDTLKFWHSLSESDQQFCAREYMGGVIIKEVSFSQPKLNYTLYFAPRWTSWDIEQNPWFGNNPYSIYSSSNPLLAGDMDYWSPGLLSFQYAVDDIFIKKVGGRNTTKNMSLRLEKMPYPAYTKSALEPFLNFLTFLWPFLATSTVIHTVSVISSEKCSGMTSYLEVMGLCPLQFYLSHGILNLIKLMFVFVPCGWLLLPSFVVVSGSLLMMTIFFYSVGVICFSLLLSSLFHSSSSAVKGALIIWILSLAMEMICKHQIAPNFVFKCVLASLNLNTALELTVSAMEDSMRRNIPLNIWNCFEGSNFFFTYGLGIVMMIFDIVWMTLVTIYLDNVYPPGDAPRKNLLYFLQTYHGLDDAITDLENDGCSTENIESEEKMGNNEVDINVKSLTKVYETTRAVDSLSFKAYRNNINVLLGHNGAGKSTIFKMLTGMATPSAGSIEICGTKLNAETVKQCQSNLGYCPQYNSLYDLLTVREHLNLFRKLKGNYAMDCVDEFLEELELKDKADEYAKNLSGGMKRKLCIAISMIGGSKVVLLDEPTAGLDVGARNLIDDFLERYKAGRTILLTTHYMDEADRLGDRISIMVSGRLACSGSSEFLKSRFGTGYLLTIALKSDSYVNAKEKIMNTIRYYIKNAYIQTGTSLQFTVVLPVKHKSKFSSLFSQLENGSLSLGIDSFGLSLNSLEQVFLKVGEMVDNTNHLSGDSIDMAKRQASRLCDNSLGNKCGLFLWLQQLEALVKKQFIFMFRKWSRLISHFALPLFLMAFSCHLLLASSNVQHTAAYTNEFPINIDEFGRSIILLGVTNETTSDFMVNLEYVLNAIDSYRISYFNLGNKSIEELILDRPKVLPPLGMAFIMVNDIDRDLYSNSGELILKGLFNGNSRRGPIPVLATVSNARLFARKGIIRMSLQTTIPVELVANTSTRSIDERYRNAVSDDGSKIENSVLIGPVFAVVFSFLISGFVMLPVDERRSNFKHQQYLTGLCGLLYWMSVFIFDLFFYALSCGIILLILFIYGLHTSSWIVLFLFLLFWVFMPLMACLSFLFSSSVKAYTLLMLYMLLLPSFSFPTEKIMDMVYPQWHFFVHLYCEPAIILFTQGTFFTLLLVALEVRLANQVLLKFCRCEKSESDAGDEDVDVACERRRLANTIEGQLAISVKNLNKYYGSLHAVKNLSFGVEVDECFGLLGANGAGKTTTFDILTGMVFCNSGSAMVNNRSVTKNQATGYCPQFDALLEDFTAQETLQLMVSLRGYRNVKERVQDVLEAIDLKGKANKLVYKYSGGQRRRLSVGLALISQARVILLDEPTAGIDPKTRRHIWDLLGSMRDERCAMLLTSHSMEECEALCTRIGILFKGSLIAIGPPQHIKSRFGQSYTITFTLKDLRLRESLMKAVSRKFPSALLKTIHPSINLVWYLKKSPNDKWSKIFDEVHVFATSRPEVFDYSLAQTTLEEVFLRMSQRGDDERMPSYGNLAPSSSSSSSSSSLARETDSVALENFYSSYY